MTTNSTNQPESEVIVTGDKFICKRNVIMSGLSAGTVAYVKGQTYNSEYDGCITDEQGTKSHWWADSNTYKPTPNFYRFFKSLSPSTKKVSGDKSAGVEEAARIEAEHLYSCYPFPNDNWSYKAVRLAYEQGAVFGATWQSQQTQIATGAMVDRIAELKKEIAELKPRPLGDGWMRTQYALTPSTGNYEVKDSEGHIFECVFDDIEGAWYCDNYIVAWRELPTPPPKP